MILQLRFSNSGFRLSRADRRASGSAASWDPIVVRVMTFRIRARSNIKDSMTFLIAEPPLRCADQQPFQGDPVDINAPARSLHRQRGHQADPGSSWLPTSQRIGEAELTWNSLPADGRRQGGWRRSSRWSPQASRRNPGTRSKGTTASRGPDDGTQRHSAPRDQACQRRQAVKGTGSRSNAQGGAKGQSTARPCSCGPKQGAVHSRAAGSGCSIQPDLQDGGIRPWDDSRSPPRCSSRSASGVCLGRSADTSCRPTSRLSTRRQRP